MTKREHLLTIVGEECAEVHQRCSKALRFGIAEVQQDQALDNGERIFQEFNDLVAAMELLFECDITDIISLHEVDAKKSKIMNYLEYSLSCGTLTP